MCCPSADVGEGRTFRYLKNMVEREESIPAFNGLIQKGFLGGPIFHAFRCDAEIQG
jgi:hypothetical protein